ncbi:MAG: hypothetical protein KDA85_04010 [Planctomycetaceae bacterium]|nr:hypothetical protein [Planctomycetaceae bacterium]
MYRFALIACFVAFLAGCNASVSEVPPTTEPANVPTAEDNERMMRESMEKSGMGKYHKMPGSK